MTGRPSPQERSDALSRSALVGFFAELDRILQERRHLRDQTDEGGNVTEPGQREGQVAGALVR